LAGGQIRFELKRFKKENHAKLLCNVEISPSYARLAKIKLELNVSKFKKIKRGAS